MLSFALGVYKLFCIHTANSQLLYLVFSLTILYFLRVILFPIKILDRMKTFEVKSNVFPAELIFTIVSFLPSMNLLCFLVFRRLYPLILCPVSSMVTSGFKVIKQPFRHLSICNSRIISLLLNFRLNFKNKCRYILILNYFFISGVYQKCFSW